jgi:membrane protease YdiL (CAAX protease family)
MVNTIKEKISENAYLNTFLTILGYFMLSLLLSGFFTNFTHKINDINYLLTYLFTSVIFVKYHGYVLHGFKTLGSDLKNNYKSLIPIFIIGTISIFGLTFIYTHFFNIQSANEIEVEKLLKTTAFMPFLMGFFAPIYEELIFRGVLPSNTNHKIICGILSALLFATVHILSTANIYVALVYFIPYTIMGLMFSYGTVKTNNVLVSILMHIAYNCINIVLLFI